MARIRFAVLILCLLPSFESWAASPVVAATNNNSVDTNSTIHTVNLPASISSGDVLLIISTFDGDETITNWNGFTELFRGTIASGGQIATCAAAYKDATGAEGGSVDITISGTQRGAHITYRITGHEDPATQAPEVSTGATGSSTAPDPDSITPTGGSKDYLFLAIACMNDRPNTVSGVPANYSNNIGEDSTGPGGVGETTAERQLTASSEDPAAYTIDTSRNWGARTMAIHPPGGAPARRLMVIQ